MMVKLQLFSFSLHSLTAVLSHCNMNVFPGESKQRFFRCFSVQVLQFAITTLCFQTGENSSVLHNSLTFLSFGSVFLMTNPLCTRVSIESILWIVKNLAGSQWSNVMTSLPGDKILFRRCLFLTLIWILIF